jgi:putative flippase GtrA
MKLRSLLIKSYYKVIAYDKVRFVFIGGLGFVVNFLALTLIYHILKAPILVAQVISAELALLATFVGNNFWAFKGHHHVSLRSKLVKFHMSAIGGLIINTACVTILVKYAHVYYGLGLVVGSAAGLIWNYTLYKRFVFHSKKQPLETVVAELNPRPVSSDRNRS